MHVRSWSYGQGWGLDVQELKGNIRVFCRVRPLAEDQLVVEALEGQPLLHFPSTGVGGPCCPCMPTLLANYVLLQPQAQPMLQKHDHFTAEHPSMLGQEDAALQCGASLIIDRCRLHQGDLKDHVHAQGTCSAEALSCRCLPVGVASLPSTTLHLTRSFSPPAPRCPVSSSKL